MNTSAPILRMVDGDRPEKSICPNFALRLAGPVTGETDAGVRYDATATTFYGPGARFCPGRTSPVS